ncbi:hypothetical protein ACMHYB_35090 [Sorangium sp. So ce1128]
MSWSLERRPEREAKLRTAEHTRVNEGLRSQRDERSGVWTRRIAATGQPLRGELAGTRGGRSGRVEAIAVRERS